MKLYLEDSHKEESVIMLRWCLSPSEIKMIGTSCKPGQAFVLLSVVSMEEDGKNYREESRQLVPINNMATFITFVRPGRHLVFAAVVKVYHQDYRKFFLEQDGRRAGLPVWENRLLEWVDIPLQLAPPAEVAVEEKPAKKKRVSKKKLAEQPVAEQPVVVVAEVPEKKELRLRLRYFHNHGYDILPYSDESEPKEIMASVEVNVAEGFFAKKPFDWRWVNEMFEGDPMDQCSFRRRRMWAYTGQIAVVVIAYLCSLIPAIVLSVCGYRNVCWKGLNPLNVLDYAPPAVWNNVRHGNTIFFRNSKGDTCLWRIPFYPPLLLAEGLVGFGCALGISLLWPGLTVRLSLTAILSWAAIILAWILLVLALPIILSLARSLFSKAWKLFGQVIDRLGGKRLAHYIRTRSESAAVARLRAKRLAEEKKWQKVETARAQARQAEALKTELSQQAFVMNLAALQCDYVPPTKAGLDSLPESRRTVYLRFLDLKRKVCRPFPKG